jgi:hypothetical protein
MTGSRKLLLTVSILFMLAACEPPVDEPEPPPPPDPPETIEGEEGAAMALATLPESNSLG